MLRWLGEVAWRGSVKSGQNGKIILQSQTPLPGLSCNTGISFKHLRTSSRVSSWSTFLRSHSVEPAVLLRDDTVAMQQLLRGALSRVVGSANVAAEQAPQTA